MFGFAQFVVALATGASRPENVEAVQVVTQGWITDMYADRVHDPATRTGIYGVPGDPGETVIDIPTDAGLAHAYVLPAPRSQFTALLSLVLGAFFELPTVFRLDVCAVDPSAAAATATCARRAANPELTENSTPNTALSLDGRRQTGQSVGQHVCMG